MGSDAGFGAVLAIHEDLLQGFLDVLHSAARLPRAIDLDEQGVVGHLFLDVPHLTCATAFGNRFELRLTAVGPLTMPDPAGGPPQTRDVQVTATLMVKPVLTLVPTAAPPPSPAPTPMDLAFGLDAGTALLTTLDVLPLSGAPFGALERSVITAQMPTMQSTLRTKLATAGALGPPLSLEFLGPVATTVFDPVLFKVRDGELVVGFNVDFGATRTSGDPAKLVNLCRQHSIGLWLNPLVVDLAVVGARAQAASTLPAGTTLDSLSLTCAEGSLHVSGRAGMGTLGSMTFAFDLFPKLNAPDVITAHGDPTVPPGVFYTLAPAHEAMYLAIANVSVGAINRNDDLWADEIFLAVTSGGLLGGVIEGLVQWARDSAVGGIVASGGFDMAPRTFGFSFPNLPRPTVSARVEQFDVHGVDVALGTTDAGIYTGLDVRFVGLSDPGQILGPAVIAIDEVAVLPVRYVVRLPATADTGNPYVFVEWTLWGTDRKNREVSLRRQSAPAATGTRFDLTGEPRLLDPSLEHFTVECQVLAGTGTTRNATLFHGRTPLHIADRLDRTHPYVRWRHAVQVPQVTKHPSGYRTVGAAVGQVRQSDIHRTEFPGRCRTAALYSGAVLPVSDGSPRPFLEYLDALPFPRESLDDNRRLVCDYCFYGGPTRKVALIR
jgi:hypothetical protein